MIHDFSPYPYVKKSGEVFDGLNYPANSICKTCVSKECAKLGYSTKKIGIVKACLYGLKYAYNVDPFNEEIVWVGFLINGEKYPHNYKQLLASGFSITADALSKSVLNFGKQGRLHAIALDLQSRGESAALHDLKHLIAALSGVIENHNIGRITRSMSYSIDGTDAKLVKDTLFDVYNVLGAIKNQISLSDYIVSPQIAAQSDTTEIDIYRLFEKNVYIYRVLANVEEKRIECKTVNNEYISAKRQLKEVFNLLPSILIENAIKYSYRGTNIDIVFEMKKGALSIAVRSRGPVIPADSKDLIWDKGGRFVHPNEPTKAGSGHGLYLAREICSATGFSISYRAENLANTGGTVSGDNIFTIQDPDFPAA